MAQTTFPFTLTTADGLPAQGTSSDVTTSFSSWKSPTYTFAEPVSSFRLTVTHTAYQDAYNTYANGSRGYVFFTMGEFYLYDGEGNPIAITAENITSNACETSEGSIANLVDGDVSTFFHSTWNTFDNTRDDCEYALCGGEHYLEITFPEPLSSFAFGFYKRANNANIPSEIIVTAGGVEADPFAEYGFQMGEATTDIQPGQLYVLGDKGNVTAYGGIELFVAPNNYGSWYSTSGQTAYHVRTKANVDCIYQVIDAGDGTFYLKNYLNGSYVKNASGFEEQATALADAAKLTYDEGQFLTSTTGITYCTNSQASFVGYADNKNRPIYFYPVTINNSFAMSALTDMISQAEEALAANKEAFAGSDDGETADLEAAIATAKTYTVDSQFNDILAGKSELESALMAFMKIKLYICLDTVSELIDTAEFGSNIGLYPLAQKTILEDLLQQLQADIDGRSFANIAELNDYVATVQATLDAFYASKLTTYSEWPTTIMADDQLGILTSYPEESTNTQKYVYNSPTFILENTIDQFYVTFIHTNSGDNGGGYECTALANFAVYDQDGEEVDLDESCFSTNAQESSEGPIADICDKNADGTPNVSTYFHTRWSSTDLTTGEHYLCVTLPQSLSCFSFQYITRGTGIAPKEIVVGSEPYQAVDLDTIAIKGQITKASDIVPGKSYILWGNIYKVSNGNSGSGYYKGMTASGVAPKSQGAFEVVDAGDGTYKIHFLQDNIYIATPTDWASGSSTKAVADAGTFVFAESENLKDAFKIYHAGMYGDESAKYMLQDWSGSIGFYPITGDGFERDDTDGESDWFVYETVMPSYQVAVKSVTKKAELNTSDLYAMYGNLGALNSSAGTPGGYYEGVNAVGATATNYSLFQLENGANGTYKIHFTESGEYLKKPTDWAAMATTTDAAEAGEFVFAESSNMKDAFKIYYFDNTTYYMLQDWGSYMGSYTITDLSSDDTDGESDWTLVKYYDPANETVTRDDLLGHYTYQWDNYWDATQTLSFECNLIADEADPNGILIDHFYRENYGSLKGTFDPESKTITFPVGQETASNDQYVWVFNSVYGDDPKFAYDGMTGILTYGSQAGMQVLGKDSGESQGWNFISKTYTSLIPTEDTGVKTISMEEGEVKSVTYYNLNGQMMVAPAQGVNIVKTVYDNGTVLVQKILVK